MKRKLFYSIGILISWPLFYACIDDETRGFQTDGSPITITTTDSVYDIELGGAVVIEPEVSQTMSDLELKYEWRAIAMGDAMEGKDSLRFIGTDKILNYKFPESGPYQVRLRVENKYGSSFKYFTVNVLASFDQGILVVSNDENDQGRLSFVRAKTESEILGKTEKDFYLDAFAQVNPTEKKPQGIRDADVTGVDMEDINIFQLILVSETDGMFYFLNSKNFLLENTIDVAASLSGLRPTKICTKGDFFFQKNDICFITRDKAGHPGDLAILSMEYSFILKDAEYLPEENRYDKMVIGEGTYGSFGWWRVACCMDIAQNKLHITGYEGTFDASKHVQGQDFVGACFYDANGADGCRLLFVTTNKTNPKIIRVYKSQHRRNWSNGNFSLAEDPYEYTLEEGEELTLSFDKDIVSSDKYRCMFYSQGNRIYRWASYTNVPKLPTKAVISLPEGDEITCMQMSPSGDYLYVCAYNPNAPTELKGKLVIVNADNLKIEKVFEGISDKAVKVMWKKSN